MKMYGSLISLLLIISYCETARVFHLNSPSMGRSKRDISLAISGSCVVTGDQLFANGLLVRELNGDEQNQMQQFEQDYQQYKSNREQLESQLRNVTMKRLRNQQISPSEQQALQELRNMTTPSTPSFCDGNDTTLYLFDGCMVQNNKVYVGTTYARDLTSDESQQLDTFIQQIDAYMQYKKNQFEQKMANMGSNLRQMFGGMDMNMDGGDEGMESSTMAMGDYDSISPSPSPPTFPNPPKLCYSF